jgi:hypothetical protein
MADVTIVVQSGGSASQGDSITWQNTATERVQVSGLEGICSQGAFHVPAAAGGKSGEHVGVNVLRSATPGDHSYTYVPNLTETTAVLKVNGTMSKSQ